MSLKSKVDLLIENYNSQVNNLSSELFHLLKIKVSQEKIILKLTKNNAETDLYKKNEQILG